MKVSVFSTVVFITFLLLLPDVLSARHFSRQHSRHGHHHPTTAKPNFYGGKRMPLVKRKRADTVHVAGSTLPNCSHACGSCSPCKLVMVSFICASIEEAETCPMGYKCMCNNKSYPVP